MTRRQLQIPHLHQSISMRWAGWVHSSRRSSPHSPPPAQLTWQTTRAGQKSGWEPGQPRPTVQNSASSLEIKFKKKINFNIETDQNHLKTELMQKLSKQLPVVKREMKAKIY